MFFSPRIQRFGAMGVAAGRSLLGQINQRSRQAHSIAQTANQIIQPAAEISSALLGRDHQISKAAASAANLAGRAEKITGETARVAQHFTPEGARALRSDFERAPAATAVNTAREATNTFNRLTSFAKS
jgi:hypothetical protein